MTMENGLNYILQAGNRSTMQGSQMFSESTNPELDHKVRKVTEKFSENLHIVGNEPSLAFYRIQEHVRKSLPQLVDQRHDVEDIHQQVQGTCFDLDYAVGAVKNMHKSEKHFENIQELLKNSMFMKQQIEYEHLRKTQEKSNPSMYRSLLRTKTLDIPVGINNSDDEPSTTSHSLLNRSPLSALGELLPQPRARSSSVDEGRGKKK